MNILANLNINFLEKAKFTWILSVILVVGSIFLLSTKWLNLGLDFTGGVQIEYRSEKTIDAEAVRAALLQSGFDSAQVQPFGGNTGMQIKLPPIDASERKTIMQSLTGAVQSVNKDLELTDQQIVGASYGSELLDQGSTALFLVLAGVLFYISLRFQWKLALGAVIALLHDLIITAGFFSLTQIEFNLTVLAALLAVMGYSVNDTVVVFDRIRENFRLYHDGTETEIANKSINQTMSRTLVTSFTTLLAVVTLALFGGQLLYGFAIALIVGIFIGTYSSIFVATAFALWMKLKKEDLVPKPVEDIDDMP